MKGAVEHDIWSVLFDIEKRYIDRGFEGAPTVAGLEARDGNDKEYLIDAAAVIVAWILEDNRRAGAHAPKGPRSDGTA